MTTVLIVLLLAVGVVVLIGAFIYASEQTDTSGSRSSSTTARPSNGWTEDPNRQLKQATQLKKDGKLDEASDFLSDLIRRWEEDPPRTEAANVPEDYPGWKVYWKLASYLQKAGRTNEGWEVLQRLIDLDYPKVQAEIDYYESLSLDDGISEYEAENIAEMLEVEPEQTIFRELGQIFNKVRLFCGREGRSGEAAMFGVLGYAASMKSFWYDGQREPVVRGRFDEDTSDEAIRGVVDDLISDEENGEVRSELTQILRGWIDELPDAELEQLSSRVEGVVAIKGEPYH